MDSYDDEPDFDDLINDDIEDSFEPPPDYDESIFEDALLAQPSPSQSTQKQASKNDYLYNNPTQPEETGRDLDDVDMPQDNDDDSLLGDVVENISPAVSTGRSQKAVYSFERFTTSRGWRKRDDDEDGQQAREWKPPTRQLHKCANIHAPSAPDAQLLDMLDRTSRSRPPTSVKASNRMSLHPHAGVPCVPMTLGDGTRVHFASSKPVVTEAMQNGRHYNTLGVSIKNLMERVKAIRRRKEHQAVRSATEASLVDMQDAEEDEPDLAQEFLATVESTRLWVDRHAPSAFSHLLSDERTNREVLRALRAWDPYVFHRDPPSRPEMGGFGVQQAKIPSKEANNPRDGRPDVAARVLLLSGSPGVGKTTLAHIVARHAGYRPIEVNGSDERTESALTDRVIRAMESSTLNLRDGDFDASGKPNCLILDEIDGADAKSAIQALVDIIRADIPSRGNKGKTPYLRRPIIFVCNNKFAPALKPLLPFATQFQVSPPSTNRLVARLRSVLSFEKLTGGSGLLNQLVMTSCGDIRSCLYTLQFASARAKTMAKADATVVDISQALQTALNGNGMKDDRNDVVGTITGVFRKDKEAALGSSMLRGRFRASSTDHVLSLVEGFGDNSRVLDCLFKNVSTVSYIDPGFDRCAAAHEWLSCSDLFRTGSSDMFIPATAGAVHLLCRVEQRQDLNFSTREMADFRYQLEANSALSRKFMEGFSTRIRGRHSSKQLTVETIPYVLWILSSGEGSSSLRRGTTTVDLLSEQEKKSFDNHVGVLQTLGLTYISEEVTGFGFKEHSVSVRLDPPIEKLTFFKGMGLQAAGPRLVIPPTLKELLARQALQGRMVEDGILQTTSQDRFTNGHRSVSTEPQPLSQRIQSRENLADASTGDIRVENSLKRMERQGTGAALPLPKRKKTSMNSENFLGFQARKAKEARSARTAARVGLFRSKKIKLSHAGSGVPLGEVIRLKYVKGFTQAVRTPCRLEDLV